MAIYRYVTQGSFDAYMWQALETTARFISQVITGENAARRADDIGAQELSYAEVKAIASGNPAVLTLAEADAELQRLALLKKNHMDEQYVARRNLLVEDGGRLHLGTEAERRLGHRHFSELLSVITSKPLFQVRFRRMEVGSVHPLPFARPKEERTCVPRSILGGGSITRISPSGPPGIWFSDRRRTAITPGTQNSSPPGC